MKGYEKILITDYAHLWALIQEGYSILGFVHGHEPCKIEYRLGFRISSFGCSYHSYPNREENKDIFLSDCKELALKYIPPETEKSTNNINDKISEAEGKRDMYNGLSPDINEIEGYNYYDGMLDAYRDILNGNI